MRVGTELLALVRSAGARTVFVVGTGRNVGKTTSLRAIYESACRQGLQVALASLGRDGESPENIARGKPRLWLRPGTVFVTARAVLPSSPAAEILGASRLRSAGGSIVYARAVTAGFYELAGPPTASGVREVIDTLLVQSELALIDGAIDRVAALAGSDGGVIVAAGAGAAATPSDAVTDVAALVARLQIPAVDPAVPSIDVPGALTAADAVAFIARGERRQIVVGDPTQFVLSGRSASEALAALKVRCRRPLRVIAATVSSSGGERSFEPAQFARAVADATQLPTFDVYRGTRAA